MKKTVISIILFVTAIWTALAQKEFLCTKQGMILEYAYLNFKGKADMFVRQTIKSVTGSGNNMTIVVESHVFDKNKKPFSKDPNLSSFVSTSKITNGVVEMEMKSLVTPSMQGVLEFEGDKLRIPSTLSPGDKLENAHYIMTLYIGVKFRTEVDITEHQCLAIEDVTVPAGVFTCHKVAQTSTATMMRKTVVSKNLFWYAPGIGLVKTETYDEKGKLQNSMVLQEMK